MRVALIACGGTIAGHADATGRFSPSGGAAELLQRVTLAPQVEVVAIDALSMPSRAMSPADVLGWWRWSSRWWRWRQVSTAW